MKPLIVRKSTKKNRVQLVGKGEGVYRAISEMKAPWSQPLEGPMEDRCSAEVRRACKAVDKQSTVFAGYWFHPDKDEWMLISAWKAPKEGGWLRGLHGFSENFVGENGNLLRKALYGNQWPECPTANGLS